MAIGIRNAFLKTADTVVTSSAALVTVGLTSPIAAGQTQNITAWIPFTVGATGGVRIQVIVPAAGVIFLTTIKLFNTVAPATVLAAQQASAVFTNAVANAGLHWLELKCSIVNGANGGNVDFQLAQNTVDVLSLTVLRGGYLDVNKL